MYNEISFSGIRPSDFIDIRSICYKTGYMGTDLTDLRRFNDKTLFSIVFCDYYLYYEPLNCFVARDNKKSGKPIGYIIGSLNTRKSENRYALLIVPRIITRLLTHSIWNDIASVSQLVRFLETARTPKIIEDQFPASYHINILPDYHGKGIGTSLVNLYEEHTIANGVESIHVTTSSLNSNAIKFYKKMGYQVLAKSEHDLWSIQNVDKIVLGKKLL